MPSVKCPYCESRFDREKVKDYVFYKNRYYHAECYEKRVLEERQVEIEKEKKKEEAANKKKKEATEKANLEQFILSLFGYQTMPYVIKAQIDKYVKKEGYSYSGIHGTLNYFFIIKGNSTKDARGIGIVPYVYEEAKSYYSKKNSVEKANSNFNGVLVEVVEVSSAQTQVNTMTKRRRLIIEEEE